MKCPWCAATTDVERGQQTWGGGSNQDGQMTSQVCMRWKLCRSGGVITVKESEGLDVHVQCGAQRGVGRDSGE